MFLLKNKKMFNRQGEITNDTKIYNTRFITVLPQI